LKNYIYSFSLIYFLLLSACATTQDLENARRDFAAQTNVLESKADTIDNEIKSLQSQTEGLSTNIKSLTEERAAIKQSEADKGADITNIREMLETLTGRIDTLQKDTSDIKDGMEKMNKRISFIEKYLDIGDHKAVMAVPDSGSVNNIDMKVKMDSDTEYAMAFNSFKEENFKKARSEFETYLTHYPDKENAANANYWIGECFYFENNYDQAILNYDKVVKEYPTSDKAPYALLKEGLCFYKLGDKVTAKIIFQQIVQSYPSTNQAIIAQKKIQEME
jgi:tol-pal system protein YbgF